MEQFDRNKLEAIARTSLYTTFTNSKTIEYSFQVFNRHLRNGMKLLELGPAEGLMTNHLIKIDSTLTVIEGSSVFAEKLATRLTNIHVVNSLFEEAQIEYQFDAIILGHVLEHVEDPKAILQLIKKWLKPSGIILCAVPNARSIHRQAAVEMGLIDNIFARSEKDIHHGHMRIYTPETFYPEFTSIGFQIVSKGGYWLKPISDSQIEANWNEELLSAFMVLGEQYPDIAAEIYVIAKM